MYDQRVVINNCVMYRIQIFNDGVDIIKDNKILSLSNEDLETESCRKFWETKILPNIETIEYLNK